MVSLPPFAVPILAVAVICGATAPAAGARAAPGTLPAIPRDGAAAVVTPLPPAAAVPPSRNGPSAASRPLPPGDAGSVAESPSATGKAGLADPAVQARWQWPLNPTPAVLRPFSVGPFAWSRGHRGVDLASRPGAAVLSPAPGVVTFADTLAGRGVMVVRHPNGLRTTFEPVWPILQAGSVVSAGEAIGTVEAGSAHCGATPCLHWGVLSGRRYLDPLSMLGPVRAAVLLPLRPWNRY